MPDPLLPDRPVWEPSSTDGSSRVEAIAAWLARRGVLRFKSTADRMATYQAAGETPPGGTLTWREDNPTMLDLFDGLNWRRLAPIDVWPGGGDTVVGPVPSVNTAKIRQSGTSVYDSNVFGQVAVTFPSAFPTGVVSLVVSAVDSTADYRLVLDRTNTSRSTAVWFVRAPGSTANVGVGVRVRFSWIAEGF